MLRVDDPLLFLHGFDEGHDEGIIAQAIMILFGLWPDDTAEIVAGCNGGLFDLLGDKTTATDTRRFVIGGLNGIICCLFSPVSPV